MKTRIVAAALAAASLIGLSGCATMDRTTVGTVGGAVAGGLVGSAVGGSVSLAGGNIVFTPAANFNGAGSFAYTVADPRIRSS